MPNGITNLMRNIRRPAPTFVEGTEFRGLNREQRRALRYANPGSPRFIASSSAWQMFFGKDGAR